MKRRGCKGHALRRRYGHTSGEGPLLAVRLDSPTFGSGPATVVAHPKSVDEYNGMITDRDGARDRRMRLWRGDAPIGARVSMTLIPGTGRGKLRPVSEWENTRSEAAELLADAKRADEVGRENLARELRARADALLFGKGAR